MTEFIVELKRHENGNWIVSGECDYQELVRCKDCAYWDIYGNGEYKRCRNSRDRNYSPADFFCGHAVKAE